MLCKNCAAVVETKFCPECGQKTDFHRISIGHLVHDVIHAVTHADKGFLLLVKKLLIHPGTIAREYVEGKRKKYFNPLTFLVISSAIMAYLSHQTGFLDSMSAGGNRAGGGEISLLWKETIQLSRTAGKELTLILMGPLFALVTWLLFFRSKYNYAENFVLHSYLLGEAALVRSVIFIPLHVVFPHLTGKILYMVYEPLFLVYLVIAFKQFFGGNLFLLILKAVFARIIWIILFWMLLFVYVYLKHLIFT